MYQTYINPKNSISLLFLTRFCCMKASVEIVGIYDQILLDSQKPLNFKILDYIISNLTS